MHKHLNIKAMENLMKAHRAAVINEHEGELLTSHTIMAATYGAYLTWMLENPNDFTRDYIIKQLNLKIKEHGSI